MTRILTAAVLIPIIVGTVLWAPQWAFLAVMGLIGIAAYREFDAIAAAHGIPPSGWLGAASGLGLLLAPEPALPWVVLLALILMASKLGTSDLATALPSAAAALLGAVYIFGAWRCAAAVRALNPHWLMIALLVSWAGDTAAMYVGKAIGKRKLAPQLSPGKTQEGALASVAGGMVAAWLYGHYFIPQASVATLLIIGAAANFAGQLGDLCESAFKRGANMKDSGSTLPGHGGWLDRIDSTLFSVPAVYALLQLL
jgi:phosphatidate cytidylyltransferase